MSQPQPPQQRQPKTTVQSVPTPGPPVPAPDPGCPHSSPAPLGTAPANTGPSSCAPAPTAGKSRSRYAVYPDKESSAAAAALHRA